MGLITEEVEVVLSGNNIKWYENKGYYIPKIMDKRSNIRTAKGTKIKIKVDDLPSGSHSKIKYQCPNCRKEYEMMWKYYKKNKVLYCHKCAMKLYGTDNRITSQLSNSTSFEQWCIGNNENDILDRFDLDLNIYRPNEISYSSHTKCWFKCPNEVHESELKTLGSIIKGFKSCNKCNSFGQWLINKYGDNAIELYWSNKNTENPFKISHCSTKKVLLICQNCGEEKNIRTYDFLDSGLGCRKCSDGISYPEKFFASFLNQLNINYIKELNKSNLEWCDKYRYDFYIPAISSIVEVHGSQHYEESGYKRTLEEEQKNDSIKKLLANKNGFDENNYIVINAKHSNMQHMKKSIMNSKLQVILNIKENNIDWELCNKEACKSLVKDASELWDKGINSTQDIAKILNIHQATVVKYLKRGNENNWCNYNSEEEIEKRKIKLSKKVYLVELNKIFQSTKDAERILSINCSNISRCCNEIRRTTGGYHWMYYEDYLKLHNETNEVKTINT